MKKYFLLVFILATYTAAFSQTDTVTPKTTAPVAAQTTTKKKDWSKVNLSNRSGDHFMVQLGYDKWSGKPDSIHTKGFAHSINAYFLLDFPFKTDPRFSIGLGVGVSGSSTFFNRTIVGIASSGTKLPFRNVTDTSHYKKFKLSTVYAEVPLELRYTVDPENVNKSVKFALGAKIGTMINAHTKGKTLQNKSGSTLNAYTYKENSKRFFNTTRLAATARVGIGVFSLFGVYQINSYLKEGAGPDIRPYSIGISLSGL